jgi:ribosomal protein L37E
MPNDPKVIAADKAGKICTGDKEIHVDEKGIRSEIVSAKDERSEQNWKCKFCGAQNFNEFSSCESCGAPKTNDRYFDTDSEEVITPTSSEENHIITNYKKPNKIDIRYKPEEQIEEQPKEEFTENTNLLTVVKDKVTATKNNIANLIDSICYFFTENITRSVIILLVAILIPFLIWLFVPVQREARITSFSWERSIDVETYTLCHEDDWSVPAGGVVTDERQEIHHYDRVLDHYEQRSREVSEQVFDGYDTEYRDLGNGQCEVVQTPRYRTEYHTEYYEEPVYKDVPVYRTKYYYDIGRWLYSYPLVTTGEDQDAFWYNTELPTDIATPNYGDTRQGSRHETYYVHLVDYNDEYSTITYEYNNWLELQIGDVLRYKSFRFSKQPLGEVEVKRKEQIT